MSISGIFATGLSSLQANQVALRNVSTNVANANTEGYSRIDTQFSTLSSRNGAFGVEANITRAANKYLQAAEIRSAATASSAEVLSELLDRAQGLFGDPSDGGSVFSAVDDVFSAFGSLGLDPSAPLRQGEVVSSIQNLVSVLDQTATELSALRDETDARLRSSVEEANSLLVTIADLNQSIQTSQISGNDSSYAQNEQSQLLARLGELIDIRVEPRTLGGVDVRTSNGFLLAGEEPSVLSLGSATGLQTYSPLEIQQPFSDTTLSFEKHIKSGEIQGLLKARDVEIADLSAAFGEYAAGVVDSLNAAHNDGTSVPAPTTLTGTNTGLIHADAHSFTGIAHLSVVDTSGNVVQTLELDFDNQQITSPTGTTQAFAGGTIGDLETALNAALGEFGNGSASFADGVFSVSATGTNGISIRQDETTPSDRNGRGFSHAFGLNNIIQKEAPVNFDTGLQSTSTSGFAAGQTLTFDVRSPEGTIIYQPTVTLTGGATIGDVLTDINGGLSGFGSVSLDASTGRLSFTPSDSSRVKSIDLAEDTTSRSNGVGDDTGLSFSQIFGLGTGAQARRAENIEIRSDILSDYSNLATARPDIAGSVAGDYVLGPGDGRGAQFLENAGSVVRGFGATGAIAAQTTSINDYGARLAGVAGSKAVAAERAVESSQAIHDELSLRRASYEGVNVDEELVKLTQYQQAYNAASRLIRAASELYDTLLDLI